MRAATDRPFGVDLLTALPDRLMGDVDALIREGATMFVAGLGVPRDAIELCHERGVLVASMCGKVRHAVAAVEAGCDLVVAQGTEAGGHTGQVATMPLVPQVVDAVAGRVPVVAAGGIVDGRGLAAALVLGADGVWVGTRFIATPEARSAPGYKDALLRTAEDGTVITRSYSGKPMRAIRNAWTDHHDAHPEEVQRFPRAARSPRCGRGPSTSDPTRPRRAWTPRSRATRPDRASARSRSSSPPATSSAASSTEAETASPIWALSRRQSAAQRTNRGSGVAGAAGLVLEVVLVHALDQLLERDLALPAELGLDLGGIAEEEVDLGRPHEPRVLLDVRRPVVVAGARNARSRNSPIVWVSPVAMT